MKYEDIDAVNWFGDPRLPERFWVKVSEDSCGGCWLWRGAVNGGGYGVFQMNGMALNAHQVSYESLIAAVPCWLHLDHLCRTRLCVNPGHLEPVTPGINVQRGRTPKVTPEEVCEIRRLRKSGAPLKVLAKQYRLTVPGISLIVNRKTWRNIP